jgi:heat shock protein 1/8
VKKLVADAGLDLYDIDEIVYAGGTGCLPGLDETVLGVGFNEETVITPFSAGTAVGGGASDPTTILAKGAVIQAKLLAEILVIRTSFQRLVPRRNLRRSGLRVRPSG